MAQDTKKAPLSAPSKKSGIEDTKAHDETKGSVREGALKSGDKRDEEEKYEEDDAQEEPQASFSSENEVRNRCRVFFQLYFLQNRASFAYSYFSCTFVAGDEY